MKSVFMRYRFIYRYLYWVAAGFCLYFLGLWLSHSSSLFFLLTTSILILWPGYFIWRLLRIEAEGTFRLLIFFALGLSFYLVINLGGISLGATLNELIVFYEISLSVLFLAAFLFDFFKPFDEKPIFSWEKIWKKENVIYLVPIGLSVFILYVIAAKGADFNGDPYYHLAIVRKAIEGSKLNPSNLVFSQAGSSNPAYAFPAWHVLVAGFSKILNLDIYTVWSKLTLTLTLFSFFAWFSFAKAIFEKKNFVIIAFIFFLGFTFFSAAGYLFQRLTVPDTLAQYLLMPITFTFFLDYVQRESSQKSYKKIIVYLAVLISLLLVHAIHYFYVLLAVMLFFLIDLVFNFKDRRRSLAGLGLTIAPLAVLAGLFELKSGFISNTLRHFSGSENIEIAYAHFQNIGLPFKYAFLLTPLLLIFLKKQKGIILLISLMLLTPLIYWTPLKPVMSRIFSFVFTDRLMGNVALYYFVFAALIGFLLMLFDGGVKNFSKKEKTIYYFLMSLITIMILALEILYKSVSHFFESVFYSDSISATLDNFHLVIILLITIFSLALLAWQLAKKRGASFKDFETVFSTVFFSILIAIILFSPSATKAWQEANTARLANLDAKSEIVSVKTLGENGWEYLAKIGEPSVILTDDESAKELSTLVNHYMAYNLSSASEEELMKIFYDDIADAEKVKLLQSTVYQIDYVYLRPAHFSSACFFESHPEIVTKVYDGNAKIYKIIK